MWWLIGRFDAFRPKGRGFKSHSSHHVGTLCKSFTRSCLWRFGIKLRHSIRAVGSAFEWIWRGTVEIAWMNEWTFLLLTVAMVSECEFHFRLGRCNCYVVRLVTSCTHRASSTPSFSQAHFRRQTSWLILYLCTFAISIYVILFLRISSFIKAVELWITQGTTELLTPQGWLVRLSLGD